jgi:hypothetical protein
MPTVTRIFIKTGLVYACVGTFLSALWVINGVWLLHPLLGAIQPTALHIIVIGWLTQLIIGVALWMFPVWSKAQPRGPEWLSWTCYGLLNAGLLLRVIAEPLIVQRTAPPVNWILISSAVLQVAALWLFAALVWRRVRPKHSGR